MILFTYSKLLKSSTRLLSKRVFIALSAVSGLLRGHEELRVGESADMIFTVHLSFSLIPPNVEKG